MAKVNDGGETVRACPDCDVAGNVYRRSRDDQADDDPRYRCDRCLARFDEPTERVPKGPRTGGRNAVGEQALQEMDPDDLPTAGGET